MLGYDISSQLVVGRHRCLGYQNGDMNGKFADHFAMGGRFISLYHSRPRKQSHAFESSYKLQLS